MAELAANLNAGNPHSLGVEAVSPPRRKESITESPTEILPQNAIERRAYFWLRFAQEMNKLGVKAISLTILSLVMCYAGYGGWNAVAWSGQHLAKPLVDTTTDHISRLTATFEIDRAERAIRDKKNDELTQRRHDELLLNDEKNREAWRSVANVLAIISDDSKRNKGQ